MDDGYVELNREYAEMVAGATKRILETYDDQSIANMIMHIGMMDMEDLGGGDEDVGKTLACAAQLTLITYLCLDEFP